jgi:oxepin-CoA hydrolase/3-oxo-5,6-dehydrosuberyl-CoA semialdehyde dehydrogenase
MEINVNELLFQKLKPIEKLKDETKPQWGKINSQQMVEHLTEFVRMSNGKLDAQLVTPYKKVESVKKSLFTDQPFKHVIRIDDMPGGEPVYENNNLFFAKQVLYEELIEFYKFYMKNEYSTPMHPTFGRLNKKEWEVYHSKHFQHHFTQFDLI